MGDGPHGPWDVVEETRSRLLLLVIDRDSSAQTLRADLPDIDVEVVASAAEGLLLAGALRVDAVLMATNADDVPVATVAGLLRRRRVPMVVGVDPAGATAAAIALEAGATACIARPYRPAELTALLLGMRSSRALPGEADIHCGALHLDPRAHAVLLRGRVIDMAPQEFRVLRYLMAHEGKVISRAELWTAVWGTDRPPNSNTLSVHIRRVRLRLGDDPRKPAIVTTVGRSGYRLHAPGESSAAESPGLVPRAVEHRLGA